MKKQLFNDNWKFQKVGTEEVKNICLPHDAMIYEKRDPNAPSSDAEAFFEVGTYVYEKKSGVLSIFVIWHPIVLFPPSFLQFLSLF